MVRKFLAVAMLGLLIQALTIGPGFAQDFSSLVSQAGTLTRQWVSQIDTALQATNLTTLHAQAATALATGQQVQSLLQAALPLAPDDASRSRIQALLTHVSSAIQSGQQVAQATDLDTARSKLNAERGEAQEALNEFPSVTPQPTPSPTPPAVTATPVSTATPVRTATPVVTPTPTQLPVTGGTPTGAVVAVGFMATLAGLMLRRRRV